MSCEKPFADYDETIRNRWLYDGLKYYKTQMAVCDKILRAVAEISEGVSGADVIAWVQESASYFSRQRAYAERRIKEINEQLKGD